MKKYMDFRKLIAALAMIFVLMTSQGQAYAMGDGGLQINRLSGASRYDTAFTATRKIFTKSSTIVIADGRNFADALSASNLIIAYDSPLLLSSGNNLDELVAEIKRLSASKVYIVGGPKSVPEFYDSELAKIVEVKRVAGNNRYETSKQSLLESGLTDSIVLATGENFADALAVGSYLSLGKRGLHLVRSGNADLTDINYNNLEIVAGKDVLNLPGLDHANRILGENSYKRNLAAYKLTGADSIIVVDGRDYPDALVAISVANKTGSTIVLADGKNIDSEIRRGLDPNKSVIVIGGEKSVPTSVINKNSVSLSAGLIKKNVELTWDEKVIIDARSRFNELLNEHRRNNGRLELGLMNEIGSYANIRAKETIVKYSHDRPNGQPSLTELARIGSAYGYKRPGENIAMTYAGHDIDGRQVAEELFRMWKESAGHNRNMLDTRYERYYFDIAKDEKNEIWLGVTLFLGK